MSKISHWILLLFSILQLCESSAGVYANKYFLEKQKFMLDLLHEVEKPPKRMDILFRGHSLIANETEYLEYNSHMLEFYKKSSHGNLLPRSANFQPCCLWEHYKESRGLYYFLYNAREWETLRNNLCWARLHCNPKMFVYVVQQTFSRRQDFEHIVLPKVYEIQPKGFFEEFVVRQIEKFNLGQWSQQQYLKVMDNVTNVGKKSKIFALKHSQLEPVELQSLRQSLSLDKLMNLINIMGYEQQNIQNYWTNDVGLNAYWYYVNMAANIYDSGGDKVSSKDVRDFWFWSLNRLVQRHRLEFGGQINQKLALSKYESPSKLFDSIHKALYSQQYELKNGTVLKLTKSNDFDYFLNILYSWDMPSIYGQFLPTSGYSFETMLKQPQFFEKAQNFIQMFYKLKQNFQPTTEQHLNFSQIQIENVEISHLQTYFQLKDHDVSTLLKSSDYQWTKSMYVRQNQLFHLPFNISVNIKATESESVVMATFLSSTKGNVMFQLDAMELQLHNASTLVVRQSKDFSGYSPAHLSYSEIYQYTNYAWNQPQDFPFNLLTLSCGFPHNLMLPKGMLEGREFQLFVVVTKLESNGFAADGLRCDFSKEVPKVYDRNGIFGFASNFREKYLQYRNIFWKKIKIYHVNSIPKI